MLANTFRRLGFRFFNGVNVFTYQYSNMNIYINIWYSPVDRKGLYSGFKRLKCTFFLETFKTDHTVIPLFSLIRTYWLQLPLFQESHRGSFWCAFESAKKPQASEPEEVEQTGLAKRNSLSTSLNPNTTIIHVTITRGVLIHWKNVTITSYGSISCFFYFENTRKCSHRSLSLKHSAHRDINRPFFIVS